MKRSIDVRVPHVMKEGVEAGRSLEQSTAERSVDWSVSQLMRWVASVRAWLECTTLVLCNFLTRRH